MLRKSRGETIMPRTGISYHEVATVANQLLGEGKNPTIERIRQHIGTGSSTTIARYLREWKAQQDTTQRIALQTTLPESLVVLLKGLWERMCQEAEQPISVLQQQTTEQLQTLHQTLKERDHAYQTLEQQHHQSQQAIKQQRHQQASLEETVTLLEKQLTELKADAKHFEQRLTDRTLHIDELKRLNQQVQTNLEHYRETARDERLKAIQQYEQQINQLEQTVYRYQKEMSEVAKQSHHYQHQAEHWQQTHQALQANHQKIVHALHQSEQQLKHARQQGEETKIALHALQEKFTMQQTQETENKQQLALSAHQLTAIKTQLIAEKDHAQTLTQEKWELGQQNAQLLGQLQQMESLITE